MAGGWDPRSRVRVDAEIMLSWRWYSSRWLKEVVEFPSDLDSPLTLVCQYGFVLAKLLSYALFPDVENKYPAVSRL